MVPSLKQGKSSVMVLWLRPCLFRSSCSPGLRHKHNTHRGLRRKWSRASLHGDDPQQTSPSSLLRANDVSHHPGYPLHTWVWTTGCYTMGNWAWGNFIVQFSSYTLGLDECVCTENTTHYCNVLRVNMQSAPGPWTTLLVQYMLTFFFLTVYCDWDSLYMK